MLADVIVVTYHSRQAAARELLNFVDLARLGDPRASWSFVDNSEDSSDADFLESLLSQVPCTRVLRRPDNPGFAAACNDAARTSQARWVVYLNPDVWLDRQALGTVLDRLLEAAPDEACLAITQQTGALAHQGVSYNRAGWFMDRPVRARTGRSGVRSRIYRLVGGAGRLVGPSGGAAAFRREVFLGLGGFYEPLFAWGEDADLALRLHLRGHTCAPVDLSLPHQGGHSVTAGRVSRRRARLLVGNRITIAARLYSPPQAVAFGLFLTVVLIGKAPRMVRQGTLTAHCLGVAQACRGFRAARASYEGPRLSLRDPR